MFFERCEIFEIKNKKNLVRNSVNTAVESDERRIREVTNLT